MTEDIQLKLFTVGDLKRHFIHNQDVPLLSEQVIDHTRAYATIMNPFVNDDMAVVSAIFVDEKVAAYTYVFPDKLERPDRMLFWNTVLYVDKKYEGRGYGFIVIGQMVELYGDDYFDLDAVPASVENLKYAGLKIDYIDQYFLEKKHFSNNLKGIIAKNINCIRQRLSKGAQHLKALALKQEFNICYSNFIDDDTYRFIRMHSENDLFLRSQFTFNWILNYPFIQESPCYERVNRVCEFSSTAKSYSMVGANIRKGNNIIGFYIFRRNSKELYISYLYYNEEFENEVFASIAEHLMRSHPDKIFSANKRLIDFLDGFKLFATPRVYKKSFSHPQSFEYTREKRIQAGDGDNFI